MRIISDFHDYYDCIQREGQDQSVIYHRKRKVIKSWPFPRSMSGYHGRQDLKIVTHIVGFCGKIYPIIDMRKDDGKEIKSHPCWCLEDVDAFIESNYKKKQVVAYKATRWFRHKDWDYSRRQKHFRKFFEECAQKQDSYEESLFRKHRVPVFVATQMPGYRNGLGYWRSDNTELVLNGQLKDLEFYKIFDTYRTYQEIYMYLSGVLGLPNKPIPSADDKTMRDIKGFDKWSFKKPPSNPRKR